MEIIDYNSDYVICVKPIGLDSETGMVLVLKECLTGEFYPVHRLDQNVGGVMVYARNKKAAALLSQVIQEGKMVKEYVACVHGCVEPYGDWEDLLYKDMRKNKVFVVKKMRKGVKKARLEYRLIHSSDTSLVRITLHTGRSHQIRVQFASRGFPLVGDHKYGARDKETAPMLYSCAITFPFYGKEQHYESLPKWAL